MSWLLKIVEGPQAGAEIALVSGTRVKVGSSDDCDIVLSDASLPVFTLDVSEKTVTLVTASGEARALKPFVIETLGTTAIAFGPDEGAWQELTRPAPEPESAPAPEDAAPTAESKEEVPKPAEEPPAEEKKSSSRRRGCGCGCVCAVLTLLVLLLLAWYFWPRIHDRHPALAERVETSIETVRGWYASWTTKGKPVAQTAVQGPTLAEIAQQYGLALLEKNGRPLLKGNVRLRTERFAIRALALNENAQTTFDLTDDESLKASSDELLFVVTEGALKAVAASNRVVTLSGYAPSSAELERAIRALNADVPGIDRLETSAIQVGGTPPVAVAKTKFAAPGVKATTPARAAAVARRDYPIAGIITKPYPLVVMRNGLRLAEGAQVGTATIERIEEDKLILREGKTTFEWTP